MLKLKYFKGESNKNSIDLTDSYDNSIKFLFEGITNTVNESLPGPFTNTIRSHLAQNILTYFNFKNADLKKEHFRFAIQSILRGDLDNGNSIQLSTELDTIKDLGKSCGLPYMLEKKIFTDAFILHDESYYHMHIKEIEEHRKNFYENDTIDLNSNFYDDGQEKIDKRLELHEKWGKLNNIFKFQPLNLIKG